MSRTISIAVFACLVVISTTRVSEAERSERSERRAASSERRTRAASLRQRGLDHFVSREFQLAADDLMEAYRIDKREATLFAWAEAVREMGDCDLAKRLYQHLFDTTSDFKMSRRAELGISTCVNSGSSSTSGDIDVSAIVNGSSNSSDADGLFKADESFPAGSETAAEPEAAPGEAASEGDPAPTDTMTPSGSIAPATPALNLPRTSYFLIGGGTFVALGGLVTYATTDNGTGTANASHGETTSARSKADWRRLISASVAVLGGTVILVGVVQYRRENRRARDRVVAITPYANDSSAGVVVSGGF